MRDGVQGVDLVGRERKNAPSFAMARFLRRLWAERMTKTAEKRRLQLLETLPLGGKKLMMLVRCEGAEYLVVGNTDSVQSIVKIDRPIESREACE